MSQNSILIDQLVENFQTAMTRLDQPVRMRNMLDRFFAQNLPGGRAFAECVITGIVETVRTDFLTHLPDDEVLDELVDHYVSVCHPYSSGNRHAIVPPLRDDKTPMSNEGAEIAIHLFNTFRSVQETIYPV